MTVITYESDRSRKLPTRRAALYERFVSLLLEDEEAKRGTYKDFLEEWVSRYGQYGRVWADELFVRRRELLEHLASSSSELNSKDQVGSSGASILDLAVRWTLQRLPNRSRIDKVWLKSQIEKLLGERTGLLTRRGTELTFLHETFREFLVASHVAEKLQPTSKEHRATIVDWLERNQGQIGLFALGIWAEQGHDVSQLIRDVQKRGNWGLVFAASAIAEGAIISTQQTDLIVKLLFLGAHGRNKAIDRFEAVRILATIHGQPNIVERLVSLAEDVTLEIDFRFEITYALERLSTDAAVRVLLLIGFEGPVLIDTLSEVSSSLLNSVD